MSHDQKEINEKYDLIENTTNHLAQTINDFLSFFDKRVTSEQRSIKRIFDEVRSLSHTARQAKGIELEVVMNDSCQAVKILSSIEQVLLNLINNATDAADEKHKQAKVEFEITCDEQYLRILCTDNGKGIDATIQEKIFVPYFSTKSKAQGTGIGLYMSKQVLQKIFDGEIVLQNNKNNTVFRIEIPWQSEVCTQS
jgi:C4-dicarboxylate-specific signal transduction histidine kinase